MTEGHHLLERLEAFRESEEMLANENAELRARLQALECERAALGVSYVELVQELVELGEDLDHAGFPREDNEGEPLSALDRVRFVLERESEARLALAMLHTDFDELAREKNAALEKIDRLVESLTAMGQRADLEFDRANGWEKRARALEEQYRATRKHLSEVAAERRTLKTKLATERRAHQETAAELMSAEARLEVLQ